ncbi:unnamed protein product [Rodentolepis nana]|uniref:Transmembrane protein n=1 Tax=Rodentolepis nana TaxID=102285 RepID=A0A0R3T771_RODNA|nr:unnamed protein product [Rodentolepis nana]
MFFFSNQLNRDLTPSSVSSVNGSLEGSGGGGGILYYDRPSMLNAYRRLLSDVGVTLTDLRSEHLPTQSLWNITSIISSKANERPPILLNWYPNALTIKSRLVRLGLPDCLALRAHPPENVTVSATCDFEVNELVKVSWSGLAESAPLIKQLLDKFNIKQADYIDLLRRSVVILKRILWFQPCLDFHVLLAVSYFALDYLSVWIWNVVSIGPSRSQRSFAFFSANSSTLDPLFSAFRNFWESEIVWSLFPVVVTPDMLNYSEAVKNGKERQFRARYRELACRWLRMRTDVWREWTEGWNVKKEIIIGGMFTFTGTEEFNDLTPSLGSDAL